MSAPFTSCKLGWLNLEDWGEDVIIVDPKEIGVNVKNRMN